MSKPSDDAKGIARFWRSALGDDPRIARPKWDRVPYCMLEGLGRVCLFQKGHEANGIQEHSWQNSKRPDLAQQIQDLVDDAVGAERTRIVELLIVEAKMAYKSGDLPGSDALTAALDEIRGRK
jgi:hypothetical protein